MNFWDISGTLIDSNTSTSIVFQKTSNAASLVS